jgi:hypothetical protein
MSLSEFKAATPKEPIADRMNDNREKEIFRRIVQLQDEGVSVTESREQIANDLSMTVEQIKEIERKGLEEVWPPLD